MTVLACSQNVETRRFFEREFCRKRKLCDAYSDVFRGRKTRCCVKTVSGPSRRNFFCVDFDLDYRDQREYYDVDPLCRIVSVSEQYSPGDLYHTGLKTSGMALLSDGSPCHVEIPFFQNNQFTQFTLCVFFNYFAPPNTAMGLVVNGCPDDVNPGSIQILLTAQHQVRAEVKTAGSNYVITNSLAVTNNYHIASLQDCLACAWSTACLIHRCAQVCTGVPSCAELRSLVR